MGSHSSFRVVGRSTGVPALPVAGEATGDVPRASMADADPGAIVDSPTSKRSTAKRMGAAASTGRADGLADEPGDGLAPIGEATALAPAPTPDGPGEAPGARIGVTV